MDAEKHRLRILQNLASLPGQIKLLSCRLYIFLKFITNFLANLL